MIGSSFDSFMEVFDNVMLIANFLLRLGIVSRAIIRFSCVFTEPTTTILGSPELYIDTMSTVNLTCIVHGLNEPPTAIQWTHNGYVSCDDSHAN